MDEEIEDLVGDVNYTDSQKSVATSNVYSLDFTDSSSDKQHSSGKDTYVIECYDSDDSDQAYHLRDNQSVVNLTESKQMTLQRGAVNQINRTTSACLHIAQEIFTQTSKTIFEVAENEGVIRKTVDKQTLETQTSFISISENKTVEYRIQVTGAHNDVKNYVEQNKDQVKNTIYEVTCNQVLTSSLEDASSKFPVSESENERVDGINSGNSISCDKDKVIKIINDEGFRDSSFDDINDEYDNSSVFEKSDSDIDEDSLVCHEYNGNNNYNGDNYSDTSEVPKSVDSDVEDLYKKLSDKINVNLDRSCGKEMPRFDALSPLAEESEKVTVKTDSIMDITPDCSNILDGKDKFLVFTNSTGIKVKALPSKNDSKNERNNLRLPPIKYHQSCPTSPHVNYLLSVNSQKCLNIPYVEGQREWCVGDRWEIGSTDLAGGESPLICGRSDSSRKPDVLLLPPIHSEGYKNNISPKPSTNGASESSTGAKKSEESANRNHDSISIKDKITKLKMSSNSLKSRLQTKYNISTTETSRSASPGSASPDDNRLGDAAERGCDALCVELLRRLRSASWFEIAETLEEIPKVMEKFWPVVSEHRIADLIRVVSGHVDSPRTQVARSACHTIATILKNTNYTKKPDFYEAVTSLLVKTGSFSRPVRRAANVALDEIVCGVDLTHAVTALCIHGANHKSPLVRCAAARLLVVCCALGGGGRELLRTRPPSAVSARKHALRSLAALLEDKATETRKYAERLYSMLRPLSNFEAFYLTDVEVEVAARQMKRFDQLLLCGPPGDAR